MSSAETESITMLRSHRTQWENREYSHCLRCVKWKRTNKAKIQWCM